MLQEDRKSDTDCPQDPVHGRVIQLVTVTVKSRHSRANQSIEDKMHIETHIQAQFLAPRRKPHHLGSSRFLWDL